jgi:polysaccharide biosynthesis protein PslH
MHTANPGEPLVTRPEVLFLSHCVPWPPDKGEKIRAWNTLRATAAESEVHLACLAANNEETAVPEQLQSLCRTVTIVPRHYGRDLARAGLRFLLTGACLNEEFYRQAALEEAVRRLAAPRPLRAAVVSTVVMAPYVPPGLPIVMDLIDVDSEKWFQYAETRFPGPLFRLEARRMRNRERTWGRRAKTNLLTTRAEADLFLSFAPDASAEVIENGIDTDWFDPRKLAPALPGRLYVTFCGSMDYYPNAGAAAWFAHEVLPRWREKRPDAEFVVVGRNPGPSVRALARLPGVTVTGSVPDVRPFLRGAVAPVTPLRIARGIQNKVLEALAFGLPVLGSPAVARTFGPEAPLGLVSCATPEDYLAALENPPAISPEAIRAAVAERFQWDKNLEVLKAALRRTLGWGAGNQPDCYPNE